MSVSEYAEATIKKLGLWDARGKTDVHYSRDAAFSEVEEFRWPSVKRGGGISFESSASN